MEEVYDDRCSRRAKDNDDPFLRRNGHKWSNGGSVQVLGRGTLCTTLRGRGEYRPLII